MNLQHRMIAFQEASTHCQDIKISYNHYTLFLLSTTPSKKTNLLLLGALNFQQLFLPLILPLQVELLEPPPDLFMLQLTLLQTSRNQQNSLQKIKLKPNTRRGCLTSFRMKFFRKSNFSKANNQCLFPVQQQAPAYVTM